MREIFENIYRNKTWGEGSGGGSRGRRADEYVAMVAEFVRNSSITEITDVGAGDMVISRMIEEAVGFPIVKVDVCNPNNDPDLIVCDATYERPPFAQLMLCREVLQHLSNNSIRMLLHTTIEFPLRLFTHAVPDRVPVNFDINDGGYRGVDLGLYPFIMNVTDIGGFDHSPGFHYKVQLLK